MINVVARDPRGFNGDDILQILLACDLRFGDMSFFHRTEYEGGRMPWLYHYYAGHDTNRDWFMFNLSETRAVTKVLYHD